MAPENHDDNYIFLHFQFEEDSPSYTSVILFTKLLVFCEFCKKTKTLGNIILIENVACVYSETGNKIIFDYQQNRQKM